VEAQDGRVLARFQVINEVSQVALGLPSREGIYRAVAESIVRHFSYFEASVFEVRPAEAEVVLVAQAPPREMDREPAYRQPLEVGVIGLAVRERRTVIVADASKDPRYVQPPGREVHCASELCTPVVKDGNIVAVIDVECREADSFGESDRLALEAIANVVGLALHATDTHEALERQLAQLRQAQCQLILSERLADVGRLTSRVAHEIRNPLSTIGGFGRRILRVRALPPQAARYATIIVEETERLERLLGGIMDFVKPGEPRKVPTDVNLALQRALVQCEPAREGKRIRVTEKLEPALPPILADASQLEQAFANLIRNAFEAIPRAGEVTVASERGRDGVIVTISDTGRGIEPEQLARIFDPFFSTKSGGTGIGLTVAAKIVDDHGGRILIGSEPGKGTHARVRLPLGPASDRGEVAG